MRDLSQSLRTKNSLRVISGWICIALMILVCESTLSAQKGRGIQVVNPKQMMPDKLYKGSYALVIGVSEYVGGWDSLPGVKSDVEAVKNVFEKHGFQVVTLSSTKPTRAELITAIQQFIDDYGYEYENRLVIYFAGHGHTEPSPDGRDDIGYLVPADAPLPSKDLLGFKRKAVSMDVMRSYAVQIQAKHVMFLFDSCFSGKLVSRGNIVIPPRIVEEMKLPVRQFITAGAAHQTVPDESVFRKFFERGLLEGKADRNGDGFILGSELGDYLKDNVIKYGNGQTPQYGKIRDANLDRGDFIFVLPSKDLGCPLPGKVMKNFLGIEFICIPSGEFMMGSNEDELPNITSGLQRLHDIILPSGADLRYVITEIGKDLDLNILFDPVVFRPGRILKYSVRNLETAAALDSILIQEGLSLVVTGPGTILVTSPDRKKVILETQPVKDNVSSVAELMKKMEQEPFVDEIPKHKVVIKKAFYLAKYEVTQDQWRALMATNPSDAKDCVGGCPIENVSWYEAKEFIEKLNARGDGYEYRLPSEAEWEYAARAESLTAFAFGDDLGSTQANFCSASGGCSFNSRLSILPVGRFQPNKWNIYDMHGNVSEWCEDLYHPDYSGLPTDGTANVTKGDASVRIIRGGSWNDQRSSVRSASREGVDSNTRSSTIGFRVVAVPKN